MAKSESGKPVDFIDLTKRYKIGDKYRLMTDLKSSCHFKGDIFKITKVYKSAVALKSLKNNEDLFIHDALTKFLEKVEI